MGSCTSRHFTITEPNNTVNTASTILHLFGAEQPSCWVGEVPMSIFYSSDSSPASSAEG